MPIEQYRFSTIAQFRDQLGIYDEFLQDGYQRIISGAGRNEILRQSFPKVLYIDGTTSAGKTTLVNLLQEKIPDAHYIPESLRTIPVPYRNIESSKPIVDQLRAEFWFYQQYVKKDKEIRNHSGIVIVDRGLLGLFAYSNLLSEQNEVSLRVMWKANQRQWVPGLYVFLTARPEVIKQRLLSRNDSAKIKAEDWENGLADFIHILHTSIDSVARQANIPLIDTSDKSPQEVASEVLNLYDDFFGHPYSSRHNSN